MLQLGLVVRGAIAALAFAACAFCSGVAVASDEDASIVLFDQEQRGQYWISCFDLRDPGNPSALDLLSLDADQISRLIGLYNGVIYYLDNDRKLVSVDLRTGARMAAAEALPKRTIFEGERIYAFVEGDGAVDLISYDLRAGLKRRTRIVLPVESGWRLHAQSEDGLRRYYQSDPPPTGENWTVACRIDNLREPERAPFEFRIVGSGEGSPWAFEAAFLTDRPSTVLNVIQQSGLTTVVPVAWLEESEFACIGETLIVNGERWPQEEVAGQWCLFVVNTATGGVRSIALNEITWPAATTDKFPRISMPIDAATLSPVPEGTVSPDKALSLGPHFRADMRDWRPRVSHGQEPLRIGQADETLSYSTDKGGERILVRQREPQGRIGSCYDIYRGYIAETEYTRYYEFAYRADLESRELPVKKGWQPVSADWKPLESVPTTNLTLDNALAGRHDREAQYDFRVSIAKSTYQPGETVTVDLVLTHTGTEAAWTERPLPLYPVVTGTLAGPGSTTLLPKLPGGIPAEMPAPVLLHPGESISDRVYLNNLDPGDYTLAAAYGGNDESEWWGAARAPLVEFRVGAGGNVAGARLRLVLEKALATSGTFQMQKYLDELKQCSREDLPVVAQVLREAAGVPVERRRELPGLIHVYTCLLNMHAQELQPLYVEQLKSDWDEVRSNADVALRDLFYRSKDENVRREIQEAVREAYDGAPPLQRAFAMECFKMNAWPDMFKEMETQSRNGNIREKREAVEVLAGHYLKSLETYDGEFERVLLLILDIETEDQGSAGASALESFYGRHLDDPATLRAIDDLRIRYPEIFHRERYLDRNGLWDVVWLERAADDPTESRFLLLQASIPSLEAHCGLAPQSGYPASWAAFLQDENAMRAYRETVRTWAGCLREKPAAFRVPVLPPPGPYRLRKL